LFAWCKSAALPPSIAGEQKWRSTIVEFRVLSRISVFLVGIFLASNSFAAPGVYSANGGGRTFAGNLLQLPIAGPATGVGPLRQDPAINGGKGPITLSWNIIERIGVTSRVGLWQGGGKGAGDLLSILTGLDVEFPGAGAPPAFFGPGLRSGPATFAFCPDATQPGKTVFNGTAKGFNPDCTDPQSLSFTTGGAPAGGSGIINGILTYKATSNQFGGLASLRVVGNVDLAIMNVACPNLYCTGATDMGVFVAATSFLSGTGVGEPIDAEAVPLTWLNVRAKWLQGYTFSGLVTSTGGTIVPVATPVTNIGYGGPLTTGKVYMNVTNNAAPLPLTFTVEGYDNRDAAGIGKIQMVTGSVTQLSSSLGIDGSASRSFVTIEITPEPAMLLGAGGALLALVVSHSIVRRRSSRR
jgi:hypothetical protein